MNVIALTVTHHKRANVYLGLHPQIAKSQVDLCEQNSSLRAELTCESVYALQHSPSRNTLAGSGGGFVRRLLSSIHAGVIVLLFWFLTRSCLYNSR